MKLGKIFMTEPISELFLISIIHKKRPDMKHFGIVIILLTATTQITQVPKLVNVYLLTAIFALPTITFWPEYLRKQWQGFTPLQYPVVVEFNWNWYIVTQ